MSDTVRAPLRARVVLAYPRPVPPSSALPEPEGSLEILLHEPGRHTLTRWHNTMLCSWLHPGNTAELERLVQFSVQETKRHPRGFSSVHVVHDGLAMPDASERAVLSELIKQLHGHLVCVGVLMQGGGFWASAMQSMMTSLSIVTARTHSMRFARTPAELSAWFVEEHGRRTGVRFSAQALESALDALTKAAAG